MQDSKYSRTSISSPGGSVRPLPPLPPTPPPYLSSPYNVTSNKNSTPQSSVYNQTSVGTTELPQSTTDARLGSLSTSGARINNYTPPVMPHLVFNRPVSIPANFFGSTPTQQAENILQNISMPQSSIQSIHSMAQLQPLQPPQLPRPPQPPQHLRPPIQVSQQLELGMSLQSTVQMQMQSLQMLQQPQVSSMHMFHQSHQQDVPHPQQQQHVEHTPPPVMKTSVDNASQQQQDSGMSLHEYFKSPEAIQVFSHLRKISMFFY